MNRATPEQMAAAIKGAQVLTDAGVPWIPVPFINIAQQAYLARYGREVLENMAKEAELQEAKQDG
jgi:hypothetical protein